jgi:hypothetical protein
MRAWRPTTRSCCMDEVVSKTVPNTQPISLVPCHSLAARLVFRHAPSDSRSPACRRWVNV